MSEETPDKNAQTDQATEQDTAAEQATQAAEEAKPALPDYQYAVEDAGTLKKKISVTIPRGRIDAKLNEMFGELATSAQIPGFRVGHAPRRLIEKRFGREISTDVRNALVGEAISQLAEKQNLHTVSEPDLKLDDIKIPDSGDMGFAFEVEVAPDFELPDLSGIEVKRPVIEVNDQRIDEALDNLRRSQPRHEPTQEPAAEGDHVLAGVKITGEGLEPVERHGLTLRVAPGHVENLPILDLGKELSGKKAGDTATIQVKGPEAHPNESWRGKDLTVEIAVSSVTRTVLPEVNEDWAKGLGFESLAQLREFMGNRLRGRVDFEVQRDMRMQICKHLLDTIKFDLPDGVVARHTLGLLRRRYIDLAQRGVPQERIEESLAQMQASIGDEARNDLRLTFILGKLADRDKIEVTEGEVNSRVAAMAQQQNRRPERARQEMEADGSLGTLVDNLREEKALDKLLELAKITEITPEQAEAERKAAEEKAKAEAEKKSE